MKRRGFLVFAAGSAIWPFAARAQEKPKLSIGFLHSAAADQVVDLVAAFRIGLQEGGFSEGRNLVIEYRWAGNDYERLPELATDLVNREVRAIAAAGGDRSAIAARKVTSAIPIVAVLGGDPVAEGLVASLARPGGNVTGVSFLTASLTAKRLELLLEITPQTKVIGLLVNPKNPQTRGVIDDMEKAAVARGLEFHSRSAETEEQIAEAFAIMDRRHVGALVIQADPYFNNVRGLLISLAAKYSLPAIQERRAFVVEGGLISYGTSLPDVYRLVGVYVAKTLNGAKPTDLPVMQPTRFELIVNLKTAKELGLDVPPSLLARADEVIE